MILKQRKAKASSRGLYLQDRELINTKFQPGNAFTYVIDSANQKLIIMPSEVPSGHTVSKRKQDNVLKPVIDIRSRKALDLIADSDYLTVTIYDDQIIIDAYKAVKELVKANVPAGKIVRLEQFMPVRRVSGFQCALDDFPQVVGGSAAIFEQLEFAFELETCKAIRDSNARAALDLAYIPLQIASLFSGAGIMDYGFKQAGFDIVFAVDNNADACQTYRTNLGHHIYHGDIGMAIQRIPQVPVVIGGSPCQGFSNNNRMSNYLDNPNNLLVRKYIEAVKASGCSIFVLENVPQLLTAGDGMFRDEIMEELKEYEISYGVVNCAAYGSPQLRERSIMLGSKIGRIDLPPPTMPGEETTVREAFAGLHDGIPNQRDVSEPKPESLERIKHIPAGGNIHDLPNELRTKSIHSNMYRRLEWDKPSITIANVRKAMILHPVEDRILTVRECARLQGLPDDFVFKGRLGSMQQQVANGVPVQLAQALGRQIKKAIFQFNSLFQKPSFG